MFSVLIPLLVVIGVIVGACRSVGWICLSLLLLANPLTVFFVLGIVDYSMGAPCLQFRGLPTIESFNVDRETRCFRSGGGCCIFGNEWVFDGSHNLALEFMCAVFGPPSRAYDGPYPTREEALEIVSLAPELNRDDFVEGRIEVGGESMKMDAAMIGSWLEDAGMDWGLPEIGDPSGGKSGMHVQAAVFARRCLVLRMLAPYSLHSGLRRVDQDTIILVDMMNMRPFAYYEISGYWMRLRTARYLPEQSG